jgi:ubiquinone/menaquinone biosynthesis C-methylase UbiE/DNA-binding HxlR family transcriptional regulator
MAGLFKQLRMLSDEGRMRILRLLRHEELSVAELQEVLGMGQSRISMQLSHLKEAGLVDVRRAGQKSLYSLARLNGNYPMLAEMLERANKEVKEAEHDDAGLALVLRKRKDKLKAHFDALAGRFGRNYMPGRSWQALAEMLLRLLPPLVVADLGAGEGTVSLLLSQRAKQVIAVDNSEKMIDYGTAVAERQGVANIEYRLGDLERLPIGSAEVDLALFHQSLHHALHPERAVAEAWRILRPGGRIVILDLLRHGFDEARDLYADVWLGFSQVQLIELLHRVGFEAMDASVVYREKEAPHFEVVLALGEKLRLSKSDRETEPSERTSAPNYISVNS